MTEENARCSVSVCYIPIQDSYASAGLVSFVAGLSSSVCVRGSHRHWVIIFDHGDDLMILYEADKDNMTGNLTGRISWKSRTSVEDIYRHRTYLGNHVIPKARIQAAVQMMSKAGPYDITKNNCQTWAKQLLRKLAVEPQVELDAEEVIREVFDPATVSLLLTCGLAMSALILTPKCDNGPIEELFTRCT
ncbi:hypothetical protein HPB49_001709 [Dermacentor silvarum]|uniref:Uncharacterized protein n=1 Tax=Dermacentor silvarum TaxID=543639 RepID=A0ACB8DI60_DERSI|nr:uncharacterized protein LOC125941495 [Dermacentor silvarum]KAH7970254.1 hypothetical protein HPB49_001709 [Dermacentor silvarum]